MDLVVRECDVVFVYGVPSDEECISQLEQLFIEGGRGD